MGNIVVRRHIFEFIVEHREKRNYHPGRSEIRKIFSGLSDDVDLHLEQLAREGLLTLDTDGEQISLTPPCSAARLIKLQGDSGTGAPGMLAIDLQAVGVNMTCDLLAQVVEDDLMIDAGIRKRDIAIYRVGAPAQGEIVLAEMSGKLVFRRYLVIKAIPHLLAENPSQPDLSAAFDVHLHGILCCVISPRTNSVVGSMISATKKVNYAGGADPILKKSRWAITPSTFGLNDRVSPCYGSRRWTRTSEDPPEQFYGQSRPKTSKKSVTGGRGSELVPVVKKVNSKSVRAKDVLMPKKKAAPDDLGNKRVPPARERLRV